MSKLHEALPQTMSPENLAIWLDENQIDKKIYTLKYDLTPEDIAMYEHKSSVASRSLDILDELSKNFMAAINEGTDEPRDFTVPDTKGTKVLKANRKFADACIRNGFSEQEVELFAIPHVEEKKIVFFDSEGHPFDGTSFKDSETEKDIKTPDLTENMSDEQIALYDKPLLRAIKDEGGEKKKEKPATKKKNYMEEEQVDEKDVDI